MAKYSRDEIIKAHELYKNDRNLTKVGDMLGINRRTLARKFTEYDLPYDRRKTKVITKMSEQDILEASNMYTIGKSSIKIADYFSVSVNTVISALRSNGVAIRSNKENSRVYNIYNEDCFEVIDSQEKAYWLGFIYADGYITIGKNGQKMFGISISRKDEDLLYEFNNFIKSEYKIMKYTSTASETVRSVDYSRILITSDKMVDDLIKQGVLENKTNILKPPNLNKELIRHFIRGYMDGDGSISRYNDIYYSVKFMGTDEMLLYICSYLIKEGLVNKLNKFTKRMEGQIVSTVCYGGNLQTFRVLKHLYKDSKIHLYRKYERFRDLREHICRP